MCGGRPEVVLQVVRRRESSGAYQVGFRMESASGGRMGGPTTGWLALFTLALALLTYLHCNQAN